MLCSASCLAVAPTRPPSVPVSSTPHEPQLGGGASFGHETCSFSFMTPSPITVLCRAVRCWAVSCVWSRLEEGVAHSGSASVAGKCTCERSGSWRLTIPTPEGEGSIIRASPYLGS